MTITNGMHEHVSHVMSSGTNSAQIRFLAIGSGTGQSASSTALANQIDILALSGTGSPTTITAGSVRYSAYWGAGAGTGSIREAGIFRVSGTIGSTLMAYNDTIVVNKGANDTLKIDWDIVF